MEIHRVEQSIAELLYRQSCSDRTLLVAVSGGPDSVACLRAIVAIASNVCGVIAAHFNHQWRVNASYADADFVRQLCKRLGVRLVEGRAESQASSGKRNEDSARKARYQFLTQAAYDVGASYVVTGHTADDRIETLIHNLMRGSGLAGLATPRTFRLLDIDLVLVRPLLSVFRHEILDYLNLLHQDYRTDSSNLEQKYARNFIRNRLLPIAREYFLGGVDKQLLSMAELAEETVLALEELGRVWLQQMALATLQIPFEILERKPHAGFWMAPMEGFCLQPWPVVREGLRQLWMARAWPLKAMNRGHWERIREIVIRFEEAQSLSDDKTTRTLLNLPGDLRLVAIGQWRGLGMLEIPQET